MTQSASQIDRRLSLVSGTATGAVISNPITQLVTNLASKLPASQASYAIQMGLERLFSTTWGVVGFSIVTCFLIAFPIIRLIGIGKKMGGK